MNNFTFEFELTLDSKEERIARLLTGDGIFRLHWRQRDAVMQTKGSDGFVDALEPPKRLGGKSTKRVLTLPMLQRMLLSE